MIDVLEIVAKQKSFPFGIASPEDFATRPAGVTDASIVVTDPTISLYCLDHAAHRAMFVQVPEGVDVTAPPFLYTAQYESAVRLLSLPYETFHAVAATVELTAPLVFIQSTGRAGSTLLSKAFAEMGSVTSLSEPDVYTQAVALRLGGMPDAELRALLGSATRILFNRAFTRGAALNVVKFRSFCIEIADLLYEAFPAAGNLFLYRGIEEYTQSSVRAFGLNEAPPEMLPMIAGFLGSMTPLLAAELRQRSDLSPVEIPALMWLSTLHTYARLHLAGVPMMGVLYEDMVADPRDQLAAVLAYLGLPLGGIDGALAAFGRDSQEGSTLSRERAAARDGAIAEDAWEKVRALVRRYPIPGTDVAAGALDLPAR